MSNDYNNAYDLLEGNTPSPYDHTVWFDPDTGYIIIGLSPNYGDSIVIGSELSQQILLEGIERWISEIEAFDEAFETEFYKIV